MAGKELRDLLLRLAGEEVGDIEVWRLLLGLESLNVFKKEAAGVRGSKVFLLSFNEDSSCSQYKGKEETENQCVSKKNIFAIHWGQSSLQFYSHWVGNRYSYSHAKTREFWIASMNNHFQHGLLFKLTQDCVPDPD